MRDIYIEKDHIIIGGDTAETIITLDEIRSMNNHDLYTLLDDIHTDGYHAGYDAGFDHGCRHQEELL